MNNQKIKFQNGITLIALAIIIFITILLAGIIISISFGSNGLVERARWADYVSEFEDVNERKEIFVTTRIVEQFQDKQIPSVDYLYTNNRLNEIYYPVTNQVNTNNIADSLKNCIKEIELLDDEEFYNINKVNLYEVNLGTIASIAKHTYVVNIISGTLYNVEPVVFNGKLYHNPGTHGTKSTKLTDVGKYEMIVDASEGQVAKWESINIFYDKNVTDSVICKVYTSDDSVEWDEQNVTISNQNSNIETYDILTDIVTRFLKVEVEISDINGEHSEIDYTLVNFHKFVETQIETDVLIDNNVQKIQNMYVLSESDTESGNVTQTINIPNDGKSYAIQLEQYGNPSTTINISTPSGVQTVTLEELNTMILPPDSTITITTTLSPGDMVQQANILVKDDNITTKRISIDYTDENNNNDPANWKTVKKQKYVYNSGGTGFWQQCYIDNQEVNEHGILEISDNKRIQVKYQKSSDGSKWSKEFTNIADADNIQFLKVNVYYQTLNGASFNNTNKSIYVKLSGGSWKATFYNDHGIKIDSKRIYFANEQTPASITLPTIQNSGYLLLGWNSNGNIYAPGTSYTLTNNTDFTASYMSQRISSDNDFLAFSNAVRNGNSFENQTVILNYDIDLSNLNSESWSPIGNSSSPFKGTFDGQGHTISNININNNSSYCGFFGSISNATIKNLSLDGNIQGQNYCGLLAGVSNSSTIENVNTLETSSVNGNYCLGGLIGQASSTTITSCSNNATVSGYITIGGISGNEGIVTKCYNTANITSNTGYAGGIVGTNGTVTYSYNTGNISGYGNDGTGYTSVGGIAGAGTTARYCYNTGTIYGSMGQVAGMVGNIYNMGGTAISYCYNIGPCTGSGRAIGSLGGECLSTNIDNCVYTTSNPVNGYRGSNTNCRHLSDAEMKAFTSQYFFPDTENINGGYPILEWQR